MIKGKKFFITGGAGFIGSNFIKRIINDNKIVVYDNFKRNSLKSLGLDNHPNLDIIQGDVLDYDLLRKSIVKDVDIVIHMAAIAGIDTVIQNPVDTMKINIIGLYNLLKALEDMQILNKIERFINFSTSEVFGVNAFKVQEKDSTNLQPVGHARWTYAVSKIAGEHFIYSYHKHFGLRSVIIRPFNVYGPGQVGEGAIHHFIIRAIKNEDLIIHGDGDQIRSWCYIDDMIDGIILCLQKEEAIGEVFNIGNPRGTITILSLAEKIIHLSNSSSKIIHVPKLYADVELRIPSIEKARNLLGFHPKVDLNEGLKKTIEWYKNKLI